MPGINGASPPADVHGEGDIPRLAPACPHACMLFFAVIFWSARPAHDRRARSALNRGFALLPCCKAARSDLHTTSAFCFAKMRASKTTPRRLRKPAVQFLTYVPPARRTIIHQIRPFVPCRSAADRDRAGRDRPTIRPSGGRACSSKLPGFFRRVAVFVPGGERAMGR